MKTKVSEYISKFLEKNGINTIFCVTGGFSMHLNDSFGRNNNLKIYYFNFFYFFQLFNK